MNGRIQDLDKEIHVEAPTDLRDTCGNVNSTQSVTFRRDFLCICRVICADQVACVCGRGYYQGEMRKQGANTDYQNCGTSVTTTK